MSIIRSDGGKVKSISIVQIIMVNTFTRRTLRQTYSSDMWVWGNELYAHPPRPALPTAKNRPYHISGSHISKWTADSVVVFTTAYTRQASVVTAAVEWQEPGVEMVLPPTIRSAARIVVFSRESVPMRPAQASDSPWAPLRELNIMANSKVYPSMAVAARQGGKPSTFLPGTIFKQYEYASQ